LDKTSGPLKDIQKSLRDTATIAKKLHSEGADSAKAHAKSYRELGDSIGKAKEMISGVLSPALAALGITGFAAGEAIGKVVGALKDAAESYHKLNDAAKRGGGTVDDVNARSVAYGSLGISIDRATEAYANLGYHVDRLKRGNAEELNSWNVLPGAIQAVGNAIKDLPRSEQVPFLLNWLDKHPNTPIDQKRIILQLLGQPEELATATGESIHEALQKGLKYAAEHPDNPVLMKGLAGAFDDLDIAMKGFNADMVDTFGPTGITVVEKFATSISSLGKEIKDIWPKLPRWLEDADKIGTNIFKNPTTDDLVGGKLPNGSNPWSDLADRAGLTKLKEAVTDGVVQGLETYGKALSGPGGSGYQPMAYHPDGSGGGDKEDNTPIGKAVRDAIHGPAGDPSVDAPGHSGESTGEAGDGGGIDRSKWLAQLEANPALKDELYRRSLGENSDPTANQAVMEEAANRADIRGNKGFADHSNLKYFQGYYRGKITPKMRAILDRNYDRVFRHGSDVAGGAIDNSSQWLSAKHERNGRFRTVVNYGGDRITGHHGVESFEVPGSGESGRGEKANWPAFRQNQLNDMARRREAQMHTVKGDASLNIGLTGFPKGTTTDLTYGGLFTEYTMTKGRQMELSEQK
jgi:hypothetical protein